MIDMDLAQIFAKSALEQRLESFSKFYALYAEYNSHTNISGIRSETDVYTKHFLDSLMTLSSIRELLKIKTPLKILDLGTGGGFPAIPLAIALSGEAVQIWALDSVAKKTKFVSNVKEELGLDNLEVLRSRVEDLTSDYSFDIILSRALAQLSETLPKLARFLAKDALYIAYKKTDIESEILSATAVAHKHKLKLIEQKPYALLDSLDRQLLIYRKT